MRVPAWRPKNSREKIGMRSRRGDIRTARKSEPSSPPNGRIANRSLRVTKSIKCKENESSLSSSSIKGKGKQRLQVTQAVRRKSKPKSLKQAVKSPSPAQETLPNRSFLDLGTTLLGSETKRRRTNAAEYIKKRFLYDADEPKRSKHRKPRVSKLPISSVPASRRPRSQQKLDHTSTTSPEDGILPLRSRRGRRVKPKQDYSPMSHEEDDQNNRSVVATTHLRRTTKKRCKRGRKQQVSQEPDLHQRRSTWELPDLFDADDNDQIDQLSQTESILNDAHKQRFPDAADLPNYSDVLLDSMPHRTTVIGNTFDESDRRKRVLREQLRRSDQRRFRHRQLTSPRLTHKGSSFPQRSLLSPDPSSDVDIHSQDIMGFCPDSTTGHSKRSQEFDEFGHTEDEYAQSSDSRAPSEEPMQTPHEELEEEELLAPELSIIASQAGSVSNCSGSRRKSPVRPMQVRRTKTHVATTPGSQTSMLVSRADDSSFIFPQAAVGSGVYSGQLPIGEEFVPTVFQSSVVEKPCGQTIGEAHFGLKAASVLRLSSSSNTGASAIAIRSIPEHTLQLPVSTECTVPSSNLPSLLPSILGQNTTRVAPQPVSRVLTSAPPTARPTTTISSKSLLSHSTTTVNRRRPTILKRGAIAGGASVNTSMLGTQRHPEVEDNISGVPVSRTIGAFTSPVVNKPKTIVQMATTNNNPHHSPSAPAKLLQLVTTSISSPQLSTGMTASDKLFGRRPIGAASLSSAGVTISNTVPNYIDVPESQANPVQPYRYAVLRGSMAGKRYLVLGSQGVFDRNTPSSMGPTVLPTISDDLMSTEGTEAIETLPSHSDLPMATHDSELTTESHGLEDSAVASNSTIDADRTPALRAHLQPSFTFSSTIPAPNTPSVAAI